MRTKAIITILISLMVGFIIGFLTEGQLVKRDRNKWRRVSYSKIFEDRIFQIISPTESQKEQITPIINSYSQKMSELRKDTSQKFEELRNQMNNELKQYLTEEQYERLIQRRNRHPDHKGSPGSEPPPGHEKTPFPEKNNNRSVTDPGKN